MKREPLIRTQTIIVSILLLLFVTGCKKEKDEPVTATDVDGNVYKTVTIGTQVWFQENLKVTKLNDGTAIDLVTDDAAWGNTATSQYCWYGNNMSNKTVYGALYNCYCVKTNKLCPAGWHVPTDAEWTALSDFLGGEDVAGGKMKETGTAHWLSPNTGATNESGFTAVPGGYRHKLSFAGQMGEYAYFWSSTLSISQNYLRDLGNSTAELGRYDNQFENGLSVRCIKD